MSFVYKADPVRGAEWARLFAARRPDLFWTHPRVWLTPHVASMTQPETAVDAVLANLERHRRGETLVGLVDPAQGY